MRSPIRPKTFRLVLAPYTIKKAAKKQTSMAQIDHSASDVNFGNVIIRANSDSMGKRKYRPNLYAIGAEFSSLVW